VAREILKSLTPTADEKQKAAQVIIDALRGYSEKPVPEEHIDSVTLNCFIAFLKFSGNPEYVSIIAALTPYLEQVISMDQANLPGELKAAFLVADSLIGKEKASETPKPFGHFEEESIETEAKPEGETSDIASYEFNKEDPFSSSDSDLQLLLNDALTQLKDIASKDQVLEKHLKDIIARDDNSSIDIMSSPDIRKNSHRAGKQIIFNDSFIQKLITAYKYTSTGYGPYYAPYVLAHRLMHEFGHTATSESEETKIAEEVKLIKLDLRLYELMKKQGIQDTISEAFKMLEPEFPSGYYFRFLEAVSYLPETEQNRVIKYYASNRLTREEIRALTKAINERTYDNIINKAEAKIEEQTRQATQPAKAAPTPTAPAPEQAPKPFGAFEEDKTAVKPAQQSIVVCVSETIGKDQHVITDAEKSSIISAIRGINSSGKIPEKVQVAFSRMITNEEDGVRFAEYTASKIGAIIGIPVRNDISIDELLSELKGGFLTRVSEDLLSLTNPDIAKLDKTRARLMNEEELQRIITMLTKVMPSIMSEKLSQLSVYNMRMTAISRQTASSELSAQVLPAVTSKKSALSIGVRTLGELKLLAEEQRRKMKLAGVSDLKAAPVKLEARLTVDEKSKVTNDNIKDFLKLMEIDDVLDVILVPESAVNTAVEDAYSRLIAEGYTLKQIAVLDRFREGRQDVPEGVIFAEYIDDVVTAAHYDAAIELMALYATPGEIKLSVVKDEYKKWFIIKRITKINFDQLKREIEAYETVLMAA
jgi:hypothetical protein